MHLLENFQGSLEPKVRLLKLALMYDQIRGDNLRCLFAARSLLFTLDTGWGGDETTGWDRKMLRKRVFLEVYSSFETSTNIPPSY